MEIKNLAFMLTTGLLLGAGTGFVMHRADFCVAGMFRDLFLFRSGLKLRSLLLLVIASMIFFELARQCGLLSVYPFPMYGSPSLANLIGGFAFGIGMVLAGGCVVGTLYKLGSGNILSAVALAGTIVGSVLYAEIYPLWQKLSSATTIFRGKVTLPQILGVEPLPLFLISALISGIFFYRWHAADKWCLPEYAEGLLQPWKAALLLSLIGTASCIIIGMPMGITTGYSKIGSLIESLFFGTHVRSLVYFKTLPLNFRQPLTGMDLIGGPGPGQDAISLIQFPLIIGIVLGSFVSAVQMKEFRVFVRIPWPQYFSAAIGGLLLGLSSRMTPACNLWHLFGGLPILAAQSIFFLAGIFPGAWVGSLLLSKLVIK